MSSLPVIQPLPMSAALLDHVSRRMRLRAEHVLEPLGLRPRHLVALTVLRDGGQVTQQALAEVLALDSTNVVGVLNELEERDLIVRRRVPTDRRRHTVELTDAGRELLARAEFALAAAEDDILSALSHEQRLQLAELLRLVADGFTGTPCQNLPPEGASSDC